MIVSGPSGASSSVGDDVPEDSLGRLEVDVPPVEGRPGGDPGQGTLELADVVGDEPGDVLEDLEGHRAWGELGVSPQDGETGLHVRGLDVGEQAPFESAAQPVLQRGQVAGVAVGADDHLLTGLIEGVEGVEELLEDLLLAFEELDVVEQEDVESPGSGA